jgi:hypothetical protein
MDVKKENIKPGEQPKDAQKEDHRKKLKLTKEEEVKQVKLKSIERDVVTKVFGILTGLGKL